MNTPEQDQFYCRGFSKAPTPPPPCPASPGPEWIRPGELPWPDDALRRAYRDSRGAFCRQTAGGAFCLAYPLDCRAPFPLPLLFCFARAECLGTRGWWLFSFHADGTPRFGGGSDGKKDWKY